MLKFFKIIVPFLALPFLVFLSFLNREESGLAQPVVFCRQPIPIGEAYVKTINNLDRVYQFYSQELGPNLGSLIKAGEELTSTLTLNPEICNWSSCQAKEQETVIDFGNDVVFAECLEYLETEENQAGQKLGESCTEIGRLCFSAARAFPCEGDPCLLINVKNAANDFAVKKEIIAANYTVLSDFFLKPQVLLTNDIKTKEDASQNTAFITHLDLAKRKGELANEWLSVYPGFGQQTCIPNEDQRELIERGELTPIKPKTCVDALREGVYWPKASSDWCSQDCRFGLNKDCQACLAGKSSAGSDTCQKEQRELSWLADINCQLFKDCSGQCVNKETLDLECYSCLCGRFEGEEFYDEKCLDWVCGGSSLNFTCCL